MRKKFNKQKAQDLRLLGLTIKDIAQELDCAEITCYVNLKDVKVNKHFKDVSKSLVVYEFYNKNKECIYIGQSKSFHRRIIQHKSKSIWYEEIETIICYVMESFPDMVFMEAQLIIQKQPKYNDRIIESKASKFTIDYLDKITYNIYGVKLN